MKAKNRTDGYIPDDSNEDEVDYHCRMRTGSLSSATTAISHRPLHNMLLCEQLVPNLEGVATLMTTMYAETRNREPTEDRKNV